MCGLDGTGWVVWALIEAVSLQNFDCLCTLPGFAILWPKRDDFDPPDSGHMESVRGISTVDERSKQCCSGLHSV